MKRLNGIYTNCQPEDQPEGYYRDAQNITLDESLGAIVNELGTEDLGVSVGNVIGHSILPNGSVILFEKGDPLDKISIYDGQTLSTIVERDFNFDTPITAIPYLNTYDEYIIFWVDGVNPARYINITNPKTFDSDVYYNLFPATSKLPQVTIEDVFDTGGALKTGAYYFSVAYKHEDETLTNFYEVIGPAYITNTDPTESGQPGELTSKAIKLNLTNIDQEYDSVQIAVIRKIDGIFDSVELLPELPPTVTNYTYTGNESEIPGALEEIQIDNALYERPKAIAYQDDNIYLGNVEESENLEDYKLLQQYVNDVVIKPSVDKELYQPIKGANSFTSFSNVNNATKYRGFRRGEVYAFYMSFIRRDGTETKAFHVPGRAPITQNGALAEGRIRFYTGLEDEVGGIPAESIYQPLAFRPVGDGLITVTVNGNVAVDISVTANETREGVVQKIVDEVNGNATMAGIITAQRNRDRLKFISSNPGSQDNGLKVYVTGEPATTGRTTEVSEQVKREPNRYSKGNNFFFEDSDFTLFGGRDSFDTTVSIKINTEELNKEITISGLTTPSTRQQIATEIAAGLNGDVNFSAKYTASVEQWVIGSTSTGIYDVVITADAFGDSYNGDIELDPQTSYLSYDNPLRGSFSIIEELNGGQDSFDERDPIYGQGDPQTFESIMYNGLSDLQDPKHFRFRSDTDGVTGMGYWENANETYPDDIEVWGDSQTGGLAGEPVRHHHFPDVLNDNYIQRNEGVLENTYTLRPMGVKVENVTIPSELADDIVGYKLYYAKRTEENKRILDTVAPVSAKIDNQKYVRNSEIRSGGEYSADTIYTYPFSYLKDKKNMNNATHIALYSHLSEAERNSGQIKHVYDNANWNLGYKNYRVESLVYVDSENSEVSGANLKGYGFEYNLDNSRAESKLVIKLKTTGATPEPMQKNGSYPVGNICAHKTDVYNSFDLQQLVYTNYTNTDKPTATTFADSATIYGGDTFIVPYSYRVRGEQDSNGYDNLYTLFMESSDNINLRMRGDDFWEYFYPAATIEEMELLSFDLDGKGYREDTTSSDADVNAVDNYLAYNTDYSEVNDIKYPGIYGKYERIAQSYPTRVIRNSNGIRSFKQDDYLDLNKSRGSLVKLSNYNNILIPHMERALVRTRGKEDIQVGDMRAFLGTGDIFSVRPDDIIYTDLGFAGLQNKQSAISTPYGYYFFDEQAGRMYALTNEGIKDISENILRNVRQFSDVEIGYNPKDELILTKSGSDVYSYSPKRDAWISRHSYIPDYMLFDLKHLYSIKNNKLWKHSIGRPGYFYDSPADSMYAYVKNEGSSYKAASLLINSNTFLNYNQVITINDPDFDYDAVSISDGTNTANNSALEIQHGYNARLIASVLSNEINGSLNAKSFSRDNKIYIFSDDSLTIQYNGSSTLNGQITITQQEGKELNKNVTFDKFRIYNSYQDTETEDILYFKDPIENKLENIYIGNARNVLKYWVINKFRDIINIPADIAAEDQWAYKRRMEDKYHIVQLIKENKYNEEINLFGSDIVDKTSIR